MEVGSQSHLKLQITFHVPPFSPMEALPHVLQLASGFAPKLAFSTFAISPRRSKSTYCLILRIYSA
jgi:hypothetical protein